MPLRQLMDVMSAHLFSLSAGTLEGDEKRKKLRNFTPRKSVTVRLS